MKQEQGVMLVAIIALVGIVILFSISNSITGKGVSISRTIQSRQVTSTISPLRYAECTLNSANFPLTTSPCTDLNAAVLQSKGCPSNSIVTMTYSGGCVKLTEDLSSYSFVLNDGSGGFYFDCQNFMISKGTFNGNEGMVLHNNVLVKNCIVNGGPNADEKFAEGYTLDGSARVQNSVSQYNSRGFRIASTSITNPATCSGCRAQNNLAEGFSLSGTAYATAQGNPYDNGCYSSNNGGIGFQLSGSSKIDHCTAQNNGNPVLPTSKGFELKEYAILGQYCGSVGHYYGFYVMGDAKIKPQVPYSIGASNNKVGFYITERGRIEAPGYALYPDEYSIGAQDNDIYGFEFASTGPGQFPTGNALLRVLETEGTHTQTGIYIHGTGAALDLIGDGSYSSGGSTENLIGIKVEDGARLTGAGRACDNTQTNMIATSGGDIAGTWRTTPIVNQGGNVHATIIPCVQPPVCGQNGCEYWLGERCGTDNIFPHCTADCMQCSHWCSSDWPHCDTEVGESCVTCPSQCGSCGGGLPSGSPFIMKGGSPLFMKYAYDGRPCDQSDARECNLI